MLGNPGKINQFIPADGWFAVELEPNDVESRYDLNRLIAWALVDGGTDVVGLATDRELGIRMMEHDSITFYGYVHENDVTPALRDSFRKEAKARSKRLAEKV